MNAKVVWQSDKERKRGTIRIVLVRVAETADSPASAITIRIEERIRNNALGEETWIPFDNERLPSWVTALISEFVYDKRDLDKRKLVE